MGIALHPSLLVKEFFGWERCGSIHDDWSPHRVWRRVDRYHNRCQLISYLNVMICIYIFSKDEITRINATICWRVIPCHFSELVVSKDLHHLQSARRTKSSLCVVSSQCFSSCLSLWFAAVWGKLKMKEFFIKPWPVVFSAWFIGICYALRLQSHQEKTQDFSTVIVFHDHYH